MGGISAEERHGSAGGTSRGPGLGSPCQEHAKPPLGPQKTGQPDGKPAGPSLGAVKSQGPVKRRRLCGQSTKRKSVSSQNKIVAGRCLKLIQSVPPIRGKFRWPPAVLRAHLRLPPRFERKPVNIAGVRGLQREQAHGWDPGRGPRDQPAEYPDSRTQFSSRDP